MKLVSILVISALIICSSIAQGQDTNRNVPLSSIGAYGSTFENVNYNTSSEMKMGNIVYSDGIQFYSEFHPNSKEHEAYFNLDRSYDHLTGLIGMDDKSKLYPQYGYKGITLTLLGDDRELQKFTMANGDLPVSVDLDVSGVRRLTLDATYQNDDSKGGVSNDAYIDLVNMILSRVPRA